MMPRAKRGMVQGFAAGLQSAGVLLPALLIAVLLAAGCAQRYPAPAGPFEQQNPPNAPPWPAIRIPFG